MVVPTNRPASFESFCEAWEKLFWEHDVNLIPVFDDEEHYDELPWFIPRQTDMIRSWGIYKAWCSFTPYTLSLDDDVRPIDGIDIFGEYEKVFREGAVLSDYLDVGALTTSGLQMRGFPYRDRKKSEVALQYGGWSGVLDYDAATQLACPRSNEGFAPIVLPVPRGAAVTGCIMNAAWRTRYAPFMWQLPLFDGKYNRFGDIWSCLFAKKTFDPFHRAVVINGRATVSHRRASDPLKNLEREQPGIAINEKLWDVLGWVEDPYVGETLVQRYEGVIRIASSAFPDEYRRNFLHASQSWMALFS